MKRAKTEPQQTWTQSEGLKKLNLKMCKLHGKLFSAKEGAQCKACAAVADAPPQKVCKRGHSRDASIKSCPQCAKGRRKAKSADVDVEGPTLTDEQRAANAEAKAQREARRAGEGRLTLGLTA
jgi:hypothetical protein